MGRPIKSPVGGVTVKVFQTGLSLSLKHHCPWSTTERSHFQRRRILLPEEKSMLGRKPESEGRNNMGFGVKTGLGMCPGAATAIDRLLCLSKPQFFFF